MSDVWVMSEALLNKMMAPSGSGDVCLGPAHERQETDIMCEINVQKIDGTSKSKLQGTDASWRSH